jgi:hypothetical protein
MIETIRRTGVKDQVRLKKGKETNGTSQEDIIRRKSQETFTNNSQQQSTKQHKESTASQEQMVSAEETKEKTEGQTTLPDQTEKQTEVQEQTLLIGEQTVSREQSNPSPSESIDQLPAEISLFVPASESVLMNIS